MHEWSLPTRHVGRTVQVFDSIDSTNTLALSHADDPAKDGLAFIARHQSAGRGQYGRTWLAPPESCVLLSLLLFPPPQLRRPALLTVWAAVAVGELVLELTGEQAKIKWPNDVFLKGKKICGILIEQRQQADRLASVVGIGLNVRQPASYFEEANLLLGGSLFSQTGTLFEWENVAKRLLTRLDEEYSSLLDGDINSLEALWKWRLGLLGRQVKAETHQGERRGRLLDVTFDAVVLREGDVTLRLAPESIRHLSVAEE